MIHLWFSRYGEHHFYNNNDYIGLDVKYNGGVWYGILNNEAICNSADNPMQVVVNGKIIFDSTI